MHFCESYKLPDDVKWSRSCPLSDLIIMDKCWVRHREDGSFVDAAEEFAAFKAQLPDAKPQHVVLTSAAVYYHAKDGTVARWQLSDRTLTRTSAAGVVDATLCKQLMITCKGQLRGFREVLQYDDTWVGTDDYVTPVVAAHQNRIWHVPPGMTELIWHCLPYCIFINAEKQYWLWVMLPDGAWQQLQETTKEHSLFCIYGSTWLGVERMQRPGDDPPLLLDVLEKIEAEKRHRSHGGGE
jgi:hypothetical protein